MTEKRDKRSLWWLLRVYWLDGTFADALSTAMLAFILITIYNVCWAMYFNALFRVLVFRELKVAATILALLAVFGIPALLRARRQWRQDYDVYLRPKQI